MKKGLIFVLFALVSIVSYSQISWNAKVGMNMSNFTGDARHRHERLVLMLV